MTAIPVNNSELLDVISSRALPAVMTGEMFNLDGLAPAGELAERHIKCDDCVDRSAAQGVLIYQRRGYDEVHVDADPVDSAFDVFKQITDQMKISDPEFEVCDEDLDEPWGLSMSAPHPNGGVLRLLGSQGWTPGVGEHVLVSTLWADRRGPDLVDPRLRLFNSRLTDIPKQKEL